MSKVVIVVVIFCAALLSLASAADNQGVCGGACTSSASCATGSGDMLCRCINFVCSMTDLCGGGCVTDGQCKEWSAGNDKCVCSWFKCNLESRIRAAKIDHVLADLIEATKANKAKRDQLLKA